MKIQFEHVKLRPSSLELIERCNEIIEEYQAQGFRLTLRQLYYQLVTKNIIRNVDRSYKNLTGIVTSARLGGLMDWAAIEDRVRKPHSVSEWDSIQDLVEGALSAFRLPRWQGQKHYAELWVEKDALAGVLEPLAYRHHVTLMVNRGYSSASAMYEAANRFIDVCSTRDEESDLVEEVGIAYREGNKETGGEAVSLFRHPTLFYLGDHDPSGEDMVRDIRTRLKTFGIEVDVVKLALTTAQVRKYNPPPNPAKITDPRAAGYIAKHGKVSWEVDALPPPVLTRIIRDAFNSIVDQKAMSAIIDKEEVAKEKLREAAATIEAD